MCDCFFSINNFIENKLCDNCVKKMEIIIKAYGVDLGNYRIFVEKTSKGYSCYSSRLIGCVGAGNTVRECLLNMKEAINLHLEGMREDG